MDDNLAIFLVITLAMISAVILIVTTTWIRSRHRLIAERAGSEAADRIGELTGENHRLKTQVGRLEDRLAVLERIATDPAERTAREIEQLR
ncbi:MAG TPA: hypothetical protein VD887_12215 [Allosphingosinicella sp.]|nr:hypothetical protein [Allosphingosinicella sp.]